MDVLIADLAHKRHILGSSPYNKLHHHGKGFDTWPYDTVAQTAKKKERRVELTIEADWEELSLGGYI